MNGWQWVFLASMVVGLVGVGAFTQYAWTMRHSRQATATAAMVAVAVSILVGTFITAHRQRVAVDCVRLIAATIEERDRQLEKLDSADATLDEVTQVLSNHPLPQC